MYIHKFIKPPVYEDIEKNRVANLMHLILLFNGAFIILLLVGFVIFGLTDLRYIAPIVISLFFYGTFYGLLKKGFVRPSAFLFVIFSYVVLTIFTVIYGGTHSPLLFLYFVTIVIASAVLRKVYAVVIYVLVMVSATIIYLVEKTGLLSTVYQPMLDFSPLLILGTNLVIMGGIIYLSNRNFRQTLALYKNELKTREKAELNVVKANQELKKAYETTLEGWSRALELRDKEIEGHSLRVTELAIEVAKIFDFDENAIEHVYYGALLHDIGKMGIPDEILNKPGALTSEERKIINQHPTYAFEMLKDIEYLQPAISIPYSHHENWDGSGYPQGLQGKEIPLPARIFSVVDNWDALTSDRPYRKAWSNKKTINYIKEQSGKRFDPQVVDVFMKIVTRIDELLRNASKHNVHQTRGIRTAKLA